MSNNDFHFGASLVSALVLLGSAAIMGVIWAVIKGLEILLGVEIFLR